MSKLDFFKLKIEKMSFVDAKMYLFKIARQQYISLKQFVELMEYNKKYNASGLID